MFFVYGGYFGNVNAYFGSVEQQGRTTLHLHTLIWVRKAMTPQQIRDRILSGDSAFLQALVEYLEAAHVGEFSKPLSDVQKDILQRKVVETPFVDLQLQMPVPSPSCSCRCDLPTCQSCIKFNQWFAKYNTDCDQLASKLNAHICKSAKESKKKKEEDAPEARETRAVCKDTNGQCKACMPRELFSQTYFDSVTGAIRLKKGEAWYNTWTPLHEYLLRCNTDTTCMLSGTAIKAVVGYITDYVLKLGIKTHVLFEAVLKTVRRTKEVPSDVSDKKSFARRFIVCVVNALTAAMEIGSPLASAYILGFHDCYTNFNFIAMYWKSYCNEVKAFWLKASPVDETKSIRESDTVIEEKVVLVNSEKGIVGVSKLDDYSYRSFLLESFCVYEYVLRTKKSKVRKVDLDQFLSHNNIKLGGGQYSQSTTDDDTLANSKSSYKDDDDTVVSSEDISDDGDMPPRRNQSYNQSKHHTISSPLSIDVDTSDNESDSHSNISSRPIEERLLPFLEGHPQRNSHCTILYADSFTYAIDFIGGGLPRSDHGDKEYYCMVMLTLFKPWQSPVDLKKSNETWEEAFKRHHFSDYQTQLMKLV